MAGASRILANNPSLHALTSLEQSLQWRLRTTRKYDELFARLKPDLVFNGSHIHGAAGELPLRVAQRMGISEKTVAAHITTGVAALADLFFGDASEPKP